MDVNLAAVAITAIVTLAGSWVTARVTSRNTAVTDFLVALRTPHEGDPS